MTSKLRLDTLDALDELKELSSAEELKNKLLFSVVVVSNQQSTIIIIEIILISPISSFLSDLSFNQSPLFASKWPLCFRLSRLYVTIINDFADASNSDILFGNLIWFISSISKMNVGRNFVNEN